MNPRRIRFAIGASAVAALLALTACQPVPTRAGTKRVVVLGDSIPAFLIRDGSATVNTKKVTLVDGTLPACDGARNDPPARNWHGDVVPTPAACKPGWPKIYPRQVTIRADVAIVMTSTHAMLDHWLQGAWRHPCQGTARTWYQADVTARLRYLKAHAKKVVLVLPAWPTAGSRWLIPADFQKRADCVRAVLNASGRAAGVSVVDLGVYLCFGPTRCRDWRKGDGMHIDAPHAASTLGWILSQSV